MIKVTINYNKFVAIGAAEQPKLVDEYYLENYDDVYDLVMYNEKNKDKINNIHIEYDVEMPNDTDETENGED